MSVRSKQRSLRKKRGSAPKGVCRKIFRSGPVKIEPVLNTTNQGRREPNVDQRPAQILRISGYVNSKTNGENATVLSGF